MDEKTYVKHYVTHNFAKNMNITTEEVPEKLHEIFGTDDMEVIEKKLSMINQIIGGIIGIIIGYFISGFLGSSIGFLVGWFGFEPFIIWFIQKFLS
ncbi:hypothetical protein QUF50_10210 [Thiotrichales bacterium HSG1]|nr:hypothetical protein [Thiotrichales bacterium HSG1]